ncbi:histidine kinase [Flavobacterium sp. MMS24-S5]|uniref:histidine kinase n=1 Tax=Flavobacterium sp. MMS24-S5 TaxID=3416605 RepID=UPI003D0397AA
MKLQIENYNRIAKQLKDEYSKLSDFEILSLAIQIQRNQILENGLVVSSSDKHPSALEAIAIALGYEGSNSVTITDALRNISNREEV